MPLLPREVVYLVLPSLIQVNSDATESHGSVTIVREPSVGSLMPHALEHVSEDS
jgi:hypothetical protein